MGGAFGFGLKRTIKELYTFLVNNYDPGDQIYLFGFSRGACTVRLLARMIKTCGILKKSIYINKSDEDLESDVEKVYRCLQDSITKEKKLANVKTPSEQSQTTRPPINKSSTNALPPEKLPKDFHSQKEIRFMGVWDTVDAYAIPSDRLAKILDKFLYISFREHDNKLSKNVESACHALSIDDQRRTFEPVLWRENPKNNDHERIKQVWFSGAHANVGGGYPKQGLAWNTMEWMMLHAKQAGLRFVKEDIDQFTENKNVQGKMYDSRSGLGAYYTFKPRNINKLWKEYASKSTKPEIHISVFERIATRAEDYAPRNLPEKFNIDTSQLINSDDNNPEIQPGDHLAQYREKDINKLRKQISKALKNLNKNQTPLSLFNQVTDFIHYRSSYFIHYRSSYFFFVGILIIWSGGYFLYDRNVITFITAIVLSILYWFTLWKLSQREEITNNKIHSARWRKISSNKAWDFLRQ